MENTELKRLEKILDKLDKVPTAYHLENCISELAGVREVVVLLVEYLAHQHGETVSTDQYGQYKLSKTEPAPKKQ